MRARNRLRPLLLAAALLLTGGCARGESAQRGEALIRETAGLGKKTTYHLAEAVPAELSRTANLTVSESWQLIRPILSGNEEYRLETICVERGQQVEAGEPIAVLQGLGSAADIELKRLEIDAFASGRREMLTWYEEQIRNAEALPAGTEREAAERALRMEYAQLEYDKYALQADYTLSVMNRQLEELEAAAGEVVLTAPVAGTVRVLTTRYAEGDLLPANTELCRIYGSEGLRMYGSSSGSFVYGREVTFSMRSGKRTAVFTGRVVSSPEVSGDSFSNTVLFEIDAEDAELFASEAEATVSYAVLSDVFTVPKSCVKNRGGIACVDLLIGDTVCTRNVVRGPSAGQTVAILHGLQAGDQVIVSSYNS